MFKQTTAVKKIMKMDKRLRIIQGGSSAGKTIAILLILIDIAQSTNNKTISVVSETMPHLKRGAIRDFVSIMQSHKYFDDRRWNKTDFIYEFETGSKIEFFSAESDSRVRGPRRDILFINECNNISFETYRQLAIRTNEFIFLDFNPVESFWVHENIITNKELQHDFIILTYKDNEGLPDEIIKEIEAQRGDKNFWRVYGEGELGQKEGRILNNWELIDEVPHEARLVSYGLDFGYTNDPSVIVGVYYYNGGYVVDEIAYQKGLLNSAIGDILLAQPVSPTIADAAEPKSIDELRLRGLTIIPSTKGRGAVSQRISFMQQQRLWITKRSINGIKAFRNYSWIVDKDGKPTNEPEHAFSHFPDAVGYALQIKHPKEPEKTYDQPPVDLPGLGSSGGILSTLEDEVSSGDFVIPKRRQ